LGSPNARGLCPLYRRLRTYPQPKLLGVGRATELIEFRHEPESSGRAAVPYTGPRPMPCCKKAAMSMRYSPPRFDPIFVGRIVSTAWKREERKTPPVIDAPDTEGGEGDGCENHHSHPNS